TPARPAAVSTARASGLAKVDPPRPPDLESHVLRDVPLTHVYPYLNLQMLYGKHLGLRGVVTRLLEEGDAKARELQTVIEDLKRRARYRGLRVSFGYPACPELADQATLWRVLEPERIGMRLTEGFMMDPEASVSALVFHHPAAKYFKASSEGG